MALPQIKQHLLIRSIGVVLFLTAFYLITVSFLQQILSTDREITSAYIIAGITLLRYLFFFISLLLFVYPQTVFFVQHIITRLKQSYEQKRMDLPPFSFVAFLCLFMLFFITALFIGHTLGERQYQTITNPTPLDLLLDLYHSGFYFYHAATLFFIEDIDYTQIDIPTYKLYIRENYLDALESNLPLSGLEYVNGDLIINDTHYDIDARYRGDTFYHWYFKKKSWRIRLDDHKFINSSNKFNIINPKSDSHIDETLVSKMAQDVGLLTPKIYPVALFLNNEYAGVYYYSDQIDELFIRNNEKMPGDIFYGELFGDTTRNGTLFEDKNNWDIEATADGNETRAYENINALLQAVNKSDEDFYTFFNNHLGDQYLRYYALTLLIDEDRVDDYHNHKLYFNPTNGMFEPIVWDLMPFTDKEVPLNNEQSNALFSKINKNPVLVERRNILLKEYLETLSEQELFAYIDTTASSIEYEIIHDLFKDSYTAPWLLTDNEWHESQQKLKNAISKRYAFIRQELDNTTVTLYIINDSSTTFIFDIQGQSGVQLQNGDILYPGKNHALRYVYNKTNHAASFNVSSLTLSTTITGKIIVPTIIVL
ncbi:MAG: CotH kinase family protein, partial [Nanoarchaeota archaeon]